MFTGIVQCQGLVTAMRRGMEECRFRFHPEPGLANLVDGESISVNGACLSVENHAGDDFAAYASTETMRKTNLKNLAVGSSVNLERALAVGDRLGGHLVSGHVDCVAHVKHISQAGQSLKIRVGFPPQFGAQVIAKGSVALDGISLTINECGSDFLEVNVIPDSLKRTNIRQWRTGTALNMETDMLGKYVINFLRLKAGNDLPPANSGSRSLDAEFLARHGFM